MRTAEEMAEFCLQNNTGSGTSRSWTLKHFATIEKQLQNDEEVLFAFVGLHNYQSLTVHNHNFAYALTNKRFIMGQKKMMGENIQIVLRKNLNDVTKSTGMLTGILTFDTIKETFNVRSNKDEINSIYDAITEILFSTHEPTQMPMQDNKDKFAELKKYKELLDLGIIDQAEFDAKKIELL